MRIAHWDILQQIRMGPTPDMIKALAALPEADAWELFENVVADLPSDAAFQSSESQARLWEAYTALKPNLSPKRDLDQALLKALDEAHQCTTGQNLPFVNRLLLEAPLKHARLPMILLRAMRYPLPNLEAAFRRVDVTGLMNVLERSSLDDQIRAQDGMMRIAGILPEAVMEHWCTVMGHWGLNPSQADALRHHWHTYQISQHRAKILVERPVGRERSRPRS